MYLISGVPMNEESYGLPQFKFRGLVLDHNVLLGLEVKNLSKVTKFDKKYLILSSISFTP